MRRVLRAGWDDLGEGQLRFEIEATAFCHQMVRSIVGTLVAAGLGTLRAGDIRAILAAGDRAKAAPSPPATACACGRSTTDRPRWRSCPGPSLVRRPAGLSPAAPAASPEERRVRTYSPKASEITRKWFVIDAEGLVLGRLSTEAARILRGKHKPTFAPHLDTGDHVIVVNADKVVLTANKAEQKLVHRHSGYPGGLKTRTYGEAHAKKPEEAVRRAVRGHAPEEPPRPPDAHQAQGLRRPVHPHAAQQPEPLDLADARRPA